MGQAGGRMGQSGENMRPAGMQHYHSQKGIQPGASYLGMYPPYGQLKRPVGHTPGGIANPVQAKQPAEKKRKWLSSFIKSRLVRKAFIKLLSIAVMATLYLLFRERLIELMQQYAAVWEIYQHVSKNVDEKTLLGLFYYSFISSLFFIFFPIELILIFYLSLGHNAYYVAAAAIIGNILGLCINYLVGRAVGKSILKGLMRGSYEPFSRWLQKYGGWVVLLGNIIIFPIEPVSLVVGAARYNFRKFFWLSLLGKTLKFCAIILAFSYIPEEGLGIADRLLQI